MRHRLRHVAPSKVDRWRRRSFLGEGREAGQSYLDDLSLALGIIFGAQLLTGNIYEIVIPMLKRKYSEFAAKKTAGKAGARSDAEVQYGLHDYEPQDLFDDYTELIIQYGYTTLFVTAFPLAPLFALLNNYIEIRVDAQKLLHLTRRPVPQGAEDIGTWELILEIMGTSAVITNTLLICFTSESFTQGQTVSARFVSLCFAPFRRLSPVARRPAGCLECNHPTPVHVACLQIVLVDDRSFRSNTPNSRPSSSSSTSCF